MSSPSLCLCLGNFNECGSNVELAGSVKSRSIQQVSELFRLLLVYFKKVMKDAEFLQFKLDINSGPGTHQYEAYINLINCVA